LINKPVIGGRILRWASTLATVQLLCGGAAFKVRSRVDHQSRITSEPPLGVHNELPGSNLFSVIVPEWYMGILEYLST
jgi:hypothetical protein